MSLSFNDLAEPIRRVLEEGGFGSPTPPQAQALSLISNGQNVLIVAPTGSGKTEAALIPVFNNLIKIGSREGISVLYITPMRALNRDLMKRLEFWASRLKIHIEVRHGDTPPSQRRKQSKNPPNILITTPETLQAVLPGRTMRRNLQSLKCVVVDEIHALVASKRGVQLSLGLERLRKTCGEFQLIGLSATLGSPEEAARFFFGSGRNYKIVNAMVQKNYRYYIDYPVPGEQGYSRREGFISPEVDARLTAIEDLIDAHDSVLIFVNSRTIAEMIGEKLCRRRKDVGVHHGSLPREERERVENAFKNREIKALVCTSTLELGIDIGSVDTVVQYMSPRQVTSIIQRVGRSGHSLARTSEGVVISVSTDDILEASACIQLASEGKLEPSKSYLNCLDVLSHQIAGYLMDFNSMTGRDLLAEIRRTYSYADLQDESFWRVVNFLNNMNLLRIEGDLLLKTRGTTRYYFENLSMIPDETRYLVIDVTTNQNVGILGDEFMLLKARIGLHFICKGRVWQIEKIAEDHKVYVTPVDDPLAAVPGWDGEMLPVPFQLSQRTGLLRRKISDVLDSKDLEDAVNTLDHTLPAPLSARRLVFEEILNHKGMGAKVPDDSTILMEGFQKYLVIHTCFGEAVNRTLAYGFEEILSWKGLVRFWTMDGYRILMELTLDTSEVDLESLRREFFGITPEKFAEIYRRAVQRNFPFPNRVKTVAERFGALKRGRYISHPNLCSLPTRFENTPIYEEALAEAERDLIDLKLTKEIIGRVNSGIIQVSTFQARDKPTPFAYHILYRYLDLPELAAPDALAKSAAQRLKRFIFSTTLDLLCFKCGETPKDVVLGELEEEPACPTCGSKLLSPSFWQTNLMESILRKKVKKAELSKEEITSLARARMAADLVLAYGKKAIIALSVHGIGPQTASKILAKMEEDEESFYMDLLHAKLKFLSTRPFWSNQ